MDHDTVTFYYRKLLRPKPGFDFIYFSVDPKLFVIPVYQRYPNIPLPAYTQLNHPYYSQYRFTNVTVIYHYQPILS